MSADKIHTLRFRNITADTEHVMQVQGKAIGSIMEWYGCFYAGDEYGVAVDGQPVAMDQNGFHDPNSDLARLVGLT